MCFSLNYVVTAKSENVHGMHRTWQQQGANHVDIYGAGCCPHAAASARRALYRKTHRFCHCHRYITSTIYDPYALAHDLSGHGRGPRKKGRGRAHALKTV